MENNDSFRNPAHKPRLWTTQTTPMNRHFVSNPPNQQPDVPMNLFRSNLQNTQMPSFNAPFSTYVPQDPPPGSQILPRTVLPVDWEFPMFNMNPYPLGGWTEPVPFSYIQNGQTMINTTNQKLPVMPYKLWPFKRLPGGGIELADDVIDPPPPTDGEPMVYIQPFYSPFHPIVVVTHHPDHVLDKKFPTTLEELNQPPPLLLPYPPPELLTPEFTGQISQPDFGYSTNPMSQGMDARNADYVQNNDMAPLWLPSSDFTQRSVYPEVNEPKPRPSVPTEFSHLPRKCQYPERPDLFQEKLSHRPHWWRPLPPREILDQSETQVVWKSPPTNWHEPTRPSRGDYQDRREPEFGSFRNEYEMYPRKGRGRAYSNWNSPNYTVQDRQNEMAENRNFEVDNSNGMSRFQYRGYWEQPYEENEEMGESSNWDNEQNYDHPNSNWNYRGNDGSHREREFGSGYESYRERYTYQREEIQSDNRNQVNPESNTNARNHEEENAMSESHTQSTQTEHQLFPILSNVVDCRIPSDEGLSSEKPVNERQIVQMGPDVVMLSMTLQEFREWKLEKERKEKQRAEEARSSSSRVHEELNKSDRNPIPIVKMELQAADEALVHEPTPGESQSPEELDDDNNTVIELVDMESKGNQEEITQVTISEVCQGELSEENTDNRPDIVEVELEVNDEEEKQAPIVEASKNLVNLMEQETKTTEYIVKVEQEPNPGEDTTPEIFQGRGNKKVREQIVFVDITKAVSEIKQQKEVEVIEPRKSRRWNYLNKPRKNNKFADKVKPNLSAHAERKQKDDTMDIDTQDGSKLSILQENCTGYLKKTRLYSDIVKGLNTMDDKVKRPSKPIQHFLQELGYETEMGKVNADAIRKEIENLKTKKEHEKVHELEKFLKETVELAGGKELEEEEEWIDVKNKKNKRKGIGNRSAWNAGFK